MDRNEQEINSLKEKITQLEGEKKRLEAKISEIREENKIGVNKLIDEKSDLASQLIKKISEAEQQRIDIGQLEGKILELENEITNLKGIIEEKEFLLDKAAEGVETWKNRHKEAEKQKFEKQFIEADDEDNKKKERTINNLQTEKQQLENQKKDLQTKLDQARNNNRNFIGKDYQKTKMVITIMVFFSLGLNIYFILKNINKKSNKTINNNKSYDKRK